MTNREQELLELIKKNPTISQKELADTLKITRSSVGVHITNLIKKGYVVGKGYVLKEGEYISIVGGANIDIIGFPSNKLIIKDSNPGQVKVTLGGVGRNIGENLARLGVETKLISAVGSDLYGAKILEEARIIGLDMKESLVLKESPTSTYLAILDEMGDMKVAISHMDIFDKVTVEFIRTKKQVIENSKICIIDTNIPEEVIDYILTQFKGVDFFLDTVSTTKSKRVKDKIGAFHTIKPNKIEAELLSGIEIKNETDLITVAEYFLNQGVKRVFITLGDDGVYYNDGVSSKHIKNPKIDVVNATGAGDAFVAALAYSHFYDFNIEKSARFAMAASILALSHEETINPNMSVENLNKKMEETKLC
jgi:pseudouridine kinase